MKGGQVLSHGKQAVYDSRGRHGCFRSGSHTGPTAGSIPFLWPEPNKWMKVSIVTEIVLASQSTN